jgi:hypothetical protein
MQLGKLKQMPPVIAEVEGSVEMFRSEGIRQNFGGSASLIAHNHSLDMFIYGNYEFRFVEAEAMTNASNIHATSRKSALTVQAVTTWLPRVYPTCVRQELLDINRYRNTHALLLNAKSRFRARRTLLYLNPRPARILDVKIILCLVHGSFKGTVLRDRFRKC